MLSVDPVTGALVALPTKKQLGFDTWLAQGLAALLAADNTFTGQNRIKGVRNILSLTKDFGAIGDNFTNNDAAFNAALASLAPVIYIPEGTFVTTLNEAQLAGKRFTGPGFIFGASGPSGYRGPANFTRLDGQAGNTGESLSDGAYERIVAEKFVLDLNQRQSLDSKYYNYPTTPHVVEANFRSGGSGFTAYLDGNAAAGDTVIKLNAVDELSIGNTIDFYSTDGTSNRRTITAVNTGTKQITINSPLGVINNDVGHYVNNRDWILKYARTMNQVWYAQTHHLAGGDAYIYGGRIFGYKEISTAASRDFELNSTIGFMGGDLNARANGIFMTAYEFAMNDAGYNVAAHGGMVNMLRSVGPYPDIFFPDMIDPLLGKYGASWVAHAVTSGGRQPCDAGYQLRGYFHSGIDFVPGLFNSGCAIGFAADQKVFFNNRTQPNEAFTAATTGILTLVNGLTHGRLKFNNGDRARVFSTVLLPGGMIANSDYYIRDATSTTLKLSATLGGAAIAITNTGTGIHTLTSSLGKSVALGDVFGDCTLGYVSSSDSIDIVHSGQKAFAVVAGGIQAGGRPGIFKGWLTTKSTQTIPIVASGTYYTFTISVPGAADGDVFEVGVPNACDQGMFWKATCVIASTATIVCYNPSANPATVSASGEFTVTAKKY